jgi:DNA-binding transcriptional LysR family regulator
LRVFSEKAAPFGIIVRSDHPLAERINVSIGDLQGYAVVRTIDARSRNSILDQEIESMTVSLSTHIFTNALTVAKQAIRANKMVGIYTKIGFMEEVEAGELKFVPLAVMALSEYKIGVVTLGSVGISPIKRLFLNAVDRTFRSLNFGC